MKITLQELSEAQAALGRVLSSPIDVKLAYRARKIVSKIVEELKHIETSRMDLIKKYGSKVKGPDGKETEQLQVPQEKISLFTKEYSEMLKLEVDLGVQKIPYECLEGVKVTMLDIAALEKFIEEPQPEKGAKHEPRK